MPQQAPTPEEVFRRRVREVREKRGWNQTQLAERVNALNLARKQMHQTTIAKIENVDGAQKPRDVTVDEAMALAAALGVAPIHLFVPLDDTEPIRLSDPDLPAFAVRDWIRGAWPLPTGTNEEQDAFFHSERPYGELTAARYAAYVLADTLRERIRAVISGGDSMISMVGTSPHEDLETLAQALIAELGKLTDEARRTQKGWED